MSQKFNIKTRYFFNIFLSGILTIFISYLFLEKILISNANAQDTVSSNITYMQILQNPKDLDLNLKYAQQQGKIGNYKQTISTLERLNMLYPDNVEIKLY